MSKVKVLFYTTSSGRQIAKEELLALTSSQQDKAQRAIKPIVEFGVGTHLNNTKKLAGTPLWEIRVLGKDNLRLIYAVIINNIVVILYIFSKKSQKTPQKAIKTAMQRYQDAKRRLTV